MDSRDENLELKIVPICELLKEKISIPAYQRPYRWSTESAVLLFSDTFGAYKSEMPEYRLGTVVLYKDKNNNESCLDVVDGQQRLTTLAILCYCLDKTETKVDETETKGLLNAKYDSRSSKAIVDNFEVLKRKVSEINDQDIKKYKDYLLNKCTMVKIVTEKQQEAFQFFDSQNSRGKELAPHDLLKSYHLREMNDDPEDTKIKIINEWEDINQAELIALFENNLYPLVRWYRNKNGLGYSSKEINTFKGIKKSNNYHFSMYNRAANLYIERFNKEGIYELTSGSRLSQFQLTQPVIAGKRFFLYCSYYFQLYRKVKDRIEDEFKRIGGKFGGDLLPMTGAGDYYVKNLFINIIMFFVDKFNFEALTDARMKMLYKWAYSLRVKQLRVSRESVNKHALNFGKNIFAIISEMQDPSELDAVVFDALSETELSDEKIKEDYKGILNFFEGREFE